MSETGGEMRHADLPAEVEDVGRAVIGAAIEVHRTLGPGLLEKIYEQAMVHELGLVGLAAERQIEVRVPYKGVLLDAQRIDLVVAKVVLVELKCVRVIEDVHKAQTLSYLRLTGLPLGLLINFNHTSLREGVRRVVNERSPLFLSSRFRDLRVQPC